MKKAFKVGDKVRIKKSGHFIADIMEGKGFGQIGTVINIKAIKVGGHEFYSYGVEFNDKKNPALENTVPNDSGAKSIKKGASCKIIEGKVGRFGYCRNFLRENLELVDEKENLEKNEKISMKDDVICYTKDGVNYFASCDGEDTFDIEKGVMIALLKAHGVKYAKVRKLTEELEQENEGTVEQFLKGFETDVKLKKGDYVKIKDGSLGFVLGAKCYPNKVYKVLDVAGFLAGGSVILENGSMVLGRHLEKVSKNK